MMRIKLDEDEYEIDEREWDCDIYHRVSNGLWVAAITIGGFSSPHPSESKLEALLSAYVQALEASK